MLAAAKSPRFATLMFGALFIYLVAALFHLPTLFFMASGLMAAPIASYFLAAAGLARVRAERRLPPRLWPDERVEIELRIVNQAPLPKCLLLIDEHLPPGLEPDPAEPPNCVVPMLWGEPFVHRYPITARWRGRQRLAPVTATAVDAFDLLQARSVVGPADEVLVYPRTVDLSADVLTGAEENTSALPRHTAEGIDFRGTREYRPGDDLRRIHWRSTARHGKPVVVEYEEPTAADLFLVLDACAAHVWGDGPDNSFETGVTTVASLVRHELNRAAAVGAYLGSEAPVLLPMTDDRHRLRAFYEALALVEADARRSFGRVLEAAAEVAPRHTRVVVVTPGAAPGGDARETLAGLEALTRRQRNLTCAWLDPRGYPGAAPAGAALGFPAAAKGLGLTVYRIARGEVARGLLRAV